MAIGPLYRCFLEVARERGVDVDGVLQGAAFARAFRRWTGVLPREYLAARKRELGSAPGTASAPT
jgi:hypothetical protein